MSRCCFHLSLVVMGLVMAACGSEPDDGASAAAGKHTMPAAPLAGMPRSPAPDGARVFFIRPANGDKVTNPVVFEFGAEGVSIAKAGDEQPRSGHHHLIIDAGLPDLSLPVPANEQYVHFGDGRTATELTLEPGTHTVQMLLGDYRHVPHDPPVMSDVITITVE